ncbi:MAG: hypothetical protein ACXV3F_10030, partial [Frankiaceae bacterium]
MGEDGRDRQVYEDISTAVRDWRERRLTWAELLDRIEQAASQLSAASQPQAGELSWRLDRLRGLGAPAADGHAPPAPTRLLERELKQVTNVDPDWKPPPPRLYRPRSAQWLTFAGLLAAYGGVDIFFGKTSLALLALAFAAVFAALAYHARMQERHRAGRSQPARAAPATPDPAALGPAAPDPA